MGADTKILIYPGFEEKYNKVTLRDLAYKNSPEDRRDYDWVQGLKDGRIGVQDGNSELIYIWHQNDVYFTCYNNIHQGYIIQEQLEISKIIKDDNLNRRFNFLDSQRLLSSRILEVNTKQQWKKV